LLSVLRGLIPLPEYVHCPNKAFPSNANLEVPHPVSFAACAIAKEVGTSSILIFNTGKSLFLTPYCLNFFLSHFFSNSELLFLFRILKSFFLSALI
jgi:hypothetical protein